MAKSKIKFPRTLYKNASVDDGSAKKWGKWKTGGLKQGGAYHSLIVANEKELSAALEIGWIDDFSEACLGPAEPQESVEDEGF